MLASLDTADMQLRENRCVIVDLRGRCCHVRTLAVPLWVKHAMNAWQAAAAIEDGPSVTKARQIGQSLSD